MKPSTLPAKSLFRSKTAFAQALIATAGALGSISPGASTYIQANANTILLLSGILGLLLRLITRDRVVLFADPPQPGPPFPR